MQLDLESLGLSVEEVQERLIDKLAEKLLTSISVDEDGRGREIPSSFRRKWQEKIQQMINSRVDAIADAHVLPIVASLIEKFTITETNRYGEPKGKTITFTEYMVQRAEAYMQEKVNSSGKAQNEGDSYGWKGEQTRLTHAIHQHLRYHIDAAMKTILEDANKHLVNGIKGSVEASLKHIVSGMKVVCP